MTEIITASRLHAFRKCKRYHKLRYIDGWRPTTPSEPLTFGTLLHRGLEAYWRGEPLPEMVSDDPVVSIRAQAMLEAYSWPDRDDYEVLAVEEPASWPLFNPDTMRASKVYTMAGIMDLILRRRSTGECILVEHKTTGSDFSDDAADYWRRLAMDSQLSIYVLAAEAKGYQINRIIYDVLARPQLRRKLATPEEDRKYTKDGRLYANQRAEDETLDEYRERLRADIAERPDRYYGRREIARLDSEIMEGMRDIWEEAKAIREAELSGRHPRNPDACHQMGTCEYYDLCALGVNPAESSMYRRADTVHEELNHDQTGS